VCIDLDGTLSEVTWPRPGIGAPFPYTRDLLQHYADQGFGVVIYTARPASHETMIWNWLQEHEMDHLVYEVVCGKPLAGLYIDDMAVNIREVA
jgi:hydroxymethylpyrimidine pyrophosphatase-like HAD family hydrolase